MLLVAINAVVGSITALTVAAGVVVGLEFKRGAETAPRHLRTYGYLVAVCGFALLTAAAANHAAP